MPTDEHYYYVLAKDSYSAAETLLALRKLHPNVTFLSLPSFIEYKDAKSLTFVFVPGWEFFHKSSDLWLAASDKIKKGASVESPPKKKTPTTLADAIYNMTDSSYLTIRQDSFNLPFTDEFLNNLDQVAKPEKKHDHVFIGGPYNGWKMSPIFAPDGKVTIQGVGLKSKYLMYDFTVLGAPLTFWVLSSLYPDRERFVREYLLKNLADS